MSQPIKILLVEDNLPDAELIERELRRGGIDFQLCQVDDRSGFVQALDERLDVVLCDYTLPQFDGLTALALLRERAPDVPFILVSGIIGEELAVAAMREGATDYLLKDRLSRLPGAIQAALAQARLQREKRDLEARLLVADRLESLGRLASGVAHDLNNILLPILVAQNLLREHLDTPESITLLDTIESNSQRGAKVVRQLLTFARGTSGDQRPVRLASVIAEMRDIMRETFPKNIRVELDFGDPDAHVLGDPTQLHQVLMNLCVNARDAMPDGGTLMLSIRCAELDGATQRRHPSASPGKYVVLAVSDTGTGIAPEHVGRIFDPFFTTKGIDQGTGLGLSSALGIVRSHRGFIDVDSRWGSGSEFQVYLPLHQPAQAEDEAGGATGGERAGQLVLLVDDEESIRRVFRAGLERAGYRVLQACDGLGALAEFDAHASEIALIITDLAMPRMSGLAFVTALRERGATVTVIAMAGALTSEQEEAFRDLGVSRVLQKPFRFEELLQAISEALPPSAAHRDPR